MNSIAQTPAAVFHSPELTSVHSISLYQRSLATIEVFLEKIEELEALSAVPMWQLQQDLELAVQCVHLSEKQLFKKAEPACAGQPWSLEDDLKLRQLFELKTPLKQMLPEFQRSRGAIQARLVKLGLLPTTASGFRFAHKSQD
jgi:hypothetical protein